jgi:hypothetical protein
MNPLIQLKQIAAVSLVGFGLAWFGLLPKAQALLPSPTPDGGYPGGNTAEGQNALFSLTTGGFNTAVGMFSLRSNTTNSFNTAVGAGALFFNAGDENTATGAAALLSNTSGYGNSAFGSGALASNHTSFANTAMGFQALFNNNSTGSSGDWNSAFGWSAMFSNISGEQNAAFGESAMIENTFGSDNTGIGDNALRLNQTGSQNTAVGYAALQSNTVDGNTAVGFLALVNNITGLANAAVGYRALDNSTGSSNTALGVQAGSNATTGSNNVYIGAGMQGVAGESNACYIASIFGQTSANGIPVLINSSNQLGTTTSSKRFKQEIKPMNDASEAILALKPVTFRYKKELDPKRLAQFGLVAEDVEKVNPDLVVRDKEGKPYTVRYDAVNAMLLNEFLKEHKTVQEQGAMIVRQQEQIEALTAAVQKVSARLELSKSAPQTVLNNQ